MSPRGESIRAVLFRAWDVLRTELVGRALEVTREIFDCLNVKVCCSLSVITTLEFLEHHFAKVGHRLAPYDPTLSPPHHNCRHPARESVRRKAASFKRGSHSQRESNQSSRKNSSPAISGSDSKRS